MKIMDLSGQQLLRTLPISKPDIINQDLELPEEQIQYRSKKDSQSADFMLKIDVVKTDWITEQ